MSDVNPTKRLYLYIRDLLNIDESANILVYGRDNDYDNETSSKIVVDTLAPSIQQSMTKTYDGDGEEMGIDSSSHLTLEVTLQTICVLRSVLELLMASNLPEAFFYYKIFKTMKR